jgi:hypothetical protein
LCHLLAGIDVVIIGRGKKVKHHPANIKYRALIESQLEAYSCAATKGLKSNILWKVLHEVRGYSKSRLGFVKRDSDTGRWYAIDDSSAKVNISQAFRDGLENSYKSSKARKHLKRKKSLEEHNRKEEYQPDASNWSVLDRFDTNLESQANNRLPVSLNEAIGESSETADHTITRICSTATMDRFRHLLHGPTTIALETESNEFNLSLKAHQKKHSWDTFSKLFTNFGSSPNMSEDPFEPQPIAFENPSSAAVTLARPAAASFRANPTTANSSRRNSVWCETNDTGFPRFATGTWDMAGLNETQDNLSVNSATMDPVSCLKEAMMPSTGFDSGALELTSFSSLSDYSDNQDLQDILDGRKSTQKTRSKACSA